jgi:hypothetical protein
MLYLDLDGVLADFTTGVSQEIHLFATGRKEVIGSKSAPRKIRNYLKVHGRSYKVHTESSLKEPEVKTMLYLVCSQKNFFLNLPKLQTELLEEVEMMGVPYEFLTAGIGKYSVEDKQEWCTTVLNSFNTCNVVVNRNDGNSTAQLKAEFCKSPTDILVDDNEKNIEAWQQAGGIAIHWTGPECLQELLNVLRQQAIAQSSLAV